MAICRTASGSRPLAPLPPRREFRARGERRTVDRAGQRRAHCVPEERGRIGDDGEKLCLHLFAIHAARKQPLHVGISELLSVALRHAQADQVVGVHKIGFVRLKFDFGSGIRREKIHHGCKAVFVRFLVVELRDCPPESRWRTRSGFKAVRKSEAAPMRLDDYTLLLEP